MANNHQPIMALPNAGGDIPNGDAPEGITQTYKLGALLVFSSGTVIEATSQYNATSKAIGFAEAAGRNLAAAQVMPSLSIPPMPFDPARYIPCTQDTTFVGSLDAHGTLGRLLVATDVGTQVGLAKEADGIWYLDTTGTAAAVVLELVDPVGTAAGRVKFKMLMTTTVTIYA